MSLKPRPSPNIWNTPELYELENRAADPHGRITAAMQEIGDWSGRTVLDIGCGTGFHLPLWAESAAHVVGVEPHPPLAALARRRTRSLPHVTVLEGTAQSLPVPDASVDAPQVIDTESFSWPSCWSDDGVDGAVRSAHGAAVPVYVAGPDRFPAASNAWTTAL